VKWFSLLFICAAMSGCGAEGQAKMQLPTERFQLKCDPAEDGNPPEFAKEKFVVSIDLIKKTFALPGWNYEENIKSIDENSIVMRDVKVGRGSSNNPEEQWISFDLNSHNFSYAHKFAGVGPGLYIFNTRCEIA